MDYKISYVSLEGNLQDDSRIADIITICAVGVMEFHFMAELVKSDTGIDLL